MVSLLCAGLSAFPLLQAALCALPLFVIEGTVDGDTVHASFLDPLVQKVLLQTALCSGSFGLEGTVDACLELDILVQKVLMQTAFACSGSFGIVGTVAEFAGVGSSGVHGTVAVFSLSCSGSFCLEAAETNYAFGSLARCLFFSQCLLALAATCLCVVALLCDIC